MRKIGKKNFIYGIHASLSALNNPKRIVNLAKCTKQVFEKIQNKILIEKNLKKIKIVDRRELDINLNSSIHQGIYIDCDELVYKNYQDVIKEEEEKTILILDSLNDSQNVGAIIRSAYLFGIKTVFYNEKNSFSINPILIKAASGAFEKISIYKIINLNMLIKKLKEENFWIVGIDKNGKNKITDISKSIKKVIVMGSESFGMRKLVKNNCDFTLKIPMTVKDNNIESLNVSCAASIIFYALNN